MKKTLSIHSVKNLYKSISDSKKTKIILPFLFLSNIIFIPFGECGYETLVLFNVYLLIPIISPILFIYPFTYKSKKGFLLYIWFLTNIINLFMFGLIFYNSIFNIGNFLILLPLFLGVIFSFIIIKLHKNTI